MGGLGLLAEGLWGFMTPAALFTVAWSTLLGIVIGTMPGLTATMGVALLVTFTYSLTPDQAILSLMCLYVGAIYGGSRTAILLSIPGTPASAATTLDGFPLAQQGRGGLAMGLATTSSAIGTLIGIFFLALIAPVLAEFALRFGSYEFFWLALFGVVISGQLTADGDPIKGYIAGLLGLMVAMVGVESLYGVARFNFGYPALNGGINLIPAMVGAFGFAAILGEMKRRAAPRIAKSQDRVIPRLSDMLRYWRTTLRSGVIGSAVGSVPGVGEDIGAWGSYAAARRVSKEREQFGKGSLEGLIAAETGNSAAIPGAMIPTLTLALPGSAAAAVLIAAMTIHGIRPGPMLMVENEPFLYKVIAMLVLACIAITVFGLLITRPLLLIMAVRRERLMPVVYVLCVVGAFAITQRVFDIYVMLGFGVVCFVLREMRYPMAPLVMGIVLGPLLDSNLRRGLVLTSGDPTPFFTRPISALLCTMVVVSVLLSFAPVRRGLARVFRLPGRVRAGG